MSDSWLPKKVLLAGRTRILQLLSEHPLLAPGGMATTISSEGAPAEVLERERPAVVVCDTRMPRGEFDELRSCLLRRTFDCKVVLLYGRQLTPNVEARAAGIPDSRWASGRPSGLPRLAELVSVGLGACPRVHFRRETSIPVRLGVGRIEVPAVLLNVSTSGAKVQTRSGLEVGTELVFQAEARRSTAVRAKVVRSYRARTGEWCSGLRFDELQNEGELLPWLLESGGASVEEVKEAPSAGPERRRTMRVETSAQLPLKAKLWFAKGERSAYMRVVNLSEGGCSLRGGRELLEGLSPEDRQELKVLIYSPNRSFRCTATVRRREGETLGIMFRSIAVPARRMLAQFIRQARLPAPKVEEPRRHHPPRLRRA